MGKPQRKQSIDLRVIPSDVRRELLEMQTYMKLKCSCNFSLEKTVYKIIRVWGKVKKLPYNGVPMIKIAEELSTPKEELNGKFRGD